MDKILVFLKIQFLSDFRQKFGLAAIVLYMVTSAYISYKIFGVIQKPVWNALFWIIFLFSSIAFTFLSFGEAFRAKRDFYHQLFHPLEIFYGKITYHFVLLFIMSLILFFTLSIFAEFPMTNHVLFIQTLCLSVLGVSACLCFVGVLSSIAQLSTTFLAILSLPLLIPVILISVKLTAVALGFIVDSSINTDLLLLAGIDGLILGLGTILFPHLWKS